MFTQKERQALLKLAQNSLEYYVKTGEFLDPEKILKSKLTSEEFKNVSQPAGIFVTLQKDEKLRGCVGTIVSKNSIAKNVSKYAVNAGMHDGRFDPVTDSELPDLDYEISILTSPKTIKSIEEIKLGKHGVILTKGEKSAVYLPQVATEWNWNITQLLESLSKKAGLDKNAYKDENTILEIFEAEVFGKKCDKTKTKNAEFAGSFYPIYADRLNQMLDEFINNSETTKHKTRAIIVPHAGYAYSGKTAGAPYKALSENKKIKTIAIFAPCHNAHLNGIAYSSYDTFKTPLGLLQVDTELLEKIKNSEGLLESDKTFSEHSLEVQLPFVQKAFDQEIKILPFVVGKIEPEILANFLKKLWNEPSVGFVFSTDLSHYLPKKECHEKDNQTIKIIATKDYKKLQPDMLCGYYIIKDVLKFAQDSGLKIVNVSRGDSSESSGDENQVVGYAGFVIINITQALLGDNLQD